MATSIAGPSTLATQLRHYAQRWPRQAALAGDFLALLQEPQDPFLRERLAGHFTGSAWLVSADGQRALLTHHRKLERWLQPGGHADGDHDLSRVALKEAEEESGLPGLCVESGSIFDLDRHWIPERKDIPGHWHYDVRYVVRAGMDEAFVVSKESHDLAWCPISELATHADASIGRMAARWLARDA